MALQETWTDYGAGGVYRAFTVYPKGAKLPLPAVLVGQEVWGVDAHMQDVVRRIAAAGYVVFAPDLLLDAGKRPPELSLERVAEAQAFVNTLPPGGMLDPAKRAQGLASRPAEERDRIETTLSTMLGVALSKGVGAHLPAFQAAYDYLSNSDLSRGEKIGSVGYCMGGGIVALLACSRPVAATVIYYGASPPEDLLKGIQGPVMGFYGEQDERISGNVPEFAAQMRRANKAFTSHIYKGTQHAFFNDMRPSYSASASRDAFAKTLSFLNGQLGHAPTVR